MQLHPDVVWEDLCPKEIKKHPYDKRHTQANTDYLKIPEYAPRVWGNLRRGDVERSQKICYEISELNQNLQLMDNKKVDVKIESERLAGSIHISPFC